jgi:hypothetical protein
LVSLRRYLKLLGSQAITLSCLPIESKGHVEGAFNCSDRQRKPSPPPLPAPRTVPRWGLDYYYFSRRISLDPLTLRRHEGFSLQVLECRRWLRCGGGFCTFVLTGCRLNPKTTTSLAPLHTYHNLIIPEFSNTHQEFHSSSEPSLARGRVGVKPHSLSRGSVTPVVQLPTSIVDSAFGAAEDVNYRVDRPFLWIVVIIRQLNCKGARANRER